MLPPQFVASAALRRFVPARSSRWVEAKRQRDFNTADRIRAELEARGIKAEQVRPHVWEPGKRAERDSGGGRGRGGGGVMAWPPMPPLGRGRGAPGALGDGGRPKLPPNIDPSVGDWMCPACANWNWCERPRESPCDESSPCDGEFPLRRRVPMHHAHGFPPRSAHKPLLTALPQTASCVIMVFHLRLWRMSEN